MQNQGSGIFSISLLAAPIVAGMQPDDVFRPFLGYARPYSGTTAQARYNIFAEVADPQIPRLSVIADASDVQHTDYAVNIVMPQAFPTAMGLGVALFDSGAQYGSPARQQGISVFR